MCPNLPDFTLKSGLQFTHKYTLLCTRSAHVVHFKYTTLLNQWRSQNAEKITHIKGRLLDQAVILFNCVLFDMGTSLKRKNSLTEGANSCLYEQFLTVWKITFITLSDLPLMLQFLLRTCLT